MNALREGVPFGRAVRGIFQNSISFPTLDLPRCDAGGGVDTGNILQAFLSLERFDGSCKLSVWLCQIAKHLYYQHLRKTGREVPTAQSQLPESKAADNPEQAVIAKLELIDVLKEMQKLSPQMREVIYLRVMGQLSFQEIGEIVGKSENWARVTFYRGKEQLLIKRKEWTCE